MRKRLFSLSRRLNVFEDSARNFSSTVFNAVLMLFVTSQIMSVNAQCDPVSNSISGVVYEDQNFNNQYDAGDNLLGGVRVLAYDADGNLVAEELSDFGSGYVLDGLTNNDSYRLEFQVPQSDIYNGVIGSEGSMIRFVSAPSCEQSLGLRTATGYCEQDPSIAVACFVKGQRDENFDIETIVSLNHDFSPTSAVAAIAAKETTGSIWGLDWKQKNQTLYSAAFVKQYTSLSRHGLGAVFQTEKATTGAQPTSLFVDLAAEGVNVGSLSVSDPYDCAYGSQAGRIGLGGLALSEDQEILYVVNVFGNSLVEVPLSNPTSDFINEYTIPDPGCSDGEFRAFAITQRDGKIFVGGTCTAETAKSESESKAVVYEFDPFTTSMTLVFQTNYIKGYWKDDQTQHLEVAHWLTDLAITDEGNMILSMTDRIGHIYCAENDGRLDQQFPDILLAWNNGGTWTLESNGSAGSLTGTGVGNNQGPDGGEFFGDDFWPQNADLHPEIMVGSVYTHPGKSEVIGTAFDSYEEAYSGGLKRFRTADGSETGQKELYTRNYNPYLGKSSGFGDITAMCSALPLAIGNYVWSDSNNNGIQDANEGPLSGVRLNLVDENCNVIASTATDANGNYQFDNTNVDIDGDGSMDGLAFEACYFVVLADERFNLSNSGLDINGSNYMLTVANAEGNDLLDNDAQHGENMSCPSIDGLPYIKVITGTSGQNDYSFDIGLSDNPVFDLALKKLLRADTLIQLGDKVIFDIYVYNQGTVSAIDIEIADYINEGYDFVIDDNEGWSIDGLVATYKISEELKAGDVKVISITLVTNESATFGSLINIAEIKSANDIFGQVGNDIDSKPDGDPYNDAGGVVQSPPSSADMGLPQLPGSDNVITDDGSFDEDDHDPAIVRFLDLALMKVVKDEESFYLTGQEVTYEITVYNQGSVPVEDIVVVDYLPEGLEFISALNPNWRVNDEGLLEYQYNGVLEYNTSETFSLTMKIADDFEGSEIINHSEIAYGKSFGEPDAKDFDSVPNAKFGDDKGGEVGGPTDNLITDRGGIDEDDEDGARIGVRSFDLALAKTTTSTLVTPGATVSFDITITNQGTTPADNILISDYIDPGMTVTDATWTVDPINSLLYTKLLSVTNGELPLTALLPGSTIVITIDVVISATATPGIFVNRAEISGATDEVGGPVVDADSTMDDILGNDAGGVPNTPSDDEIGDDGTLDEDDEDPAAVSVVTTGIVNECDCQDDASLATLGTFVDDLKIFGPAGLTLTVCGDRGVLTPPVIAYDAGLGAYCFQVDHEDGEGYRVVICDVDGIEVEVFRNTCNYLRPEFGGGALGVCIGATETYVVTDPDPDCTYDWLVDGAPVGSGETVDITWATLGGPFVLELQATCPDTCYAPVAKEVSVGIEGSDIICLSLVNISYAENCEIALTPAMLLAGGLDPDVTYEIVVMDPHGNMLPDNVIPFDFVGEELMVKVIDACSGNSCWGKVLVEDKLAPVIECEDVSVNCIEFRDYQPTLIDNCAHDTEVILLDERIISDACDADVVKEIVRTYQAVDAFGNTSAPCSQTISIERADLTQVMWPDSFLIVENRALTCDNYPVDENGNPTVEVTGVPTLHGVDIYPVIDFACKLVVTYRDEILTQDNCKTRILRLWQIIEACASEPVSMSYPQIIEITDPVPPTIECPHDFTVFTDGYTCEAQVTFPPITFTDNCSEVVDVEIRIEGELFIRGNGGTASLARGRHLVMYHVFDGCHNEAICGAYITVDDNTPPTAVCDQHTVVGLIATDSTVHVPASVFDDGSFDDCSVTKMLVRRMNPSCGCSEENPTFDNMFHMGDYNGHHYYLSNRKLPARKAYKMAAAMGGYVTVLDTEEEANWVLNGVIAWYEDPYWIGFSDVNHENDFEWANGSSSIYDNWLAGQPDNGDLTLDPNHDYVAVNPAADGTWDDLGGFEEYRFILELDEPCGFSSHVSFCCSDAGNTEQVVLRVIDACGNYNDCMVEAEVQDKVPPVITCPADLTIDCDEIIDFDNLDKYGTATATDQCGFTLTHTYESSINSCRVGVITRTFTASDANNTAECVQRIYIEPLDSFDIDDIDFPDNFDTIAICNGADLDPENLPYPIGSPVINEDHCALVGVTYKDDVFPFTQGGSCLKILRTWKVINWCDEETVENPISWVQTIKLGNNIDPTIILAVDTTICSEDDNCDTGFINLTAVGDDDCTNASDLHWEYNIDYDTDGSIDVSVSGTGAMIDASGDLPLGSHSIVFSFEDRCGNIIAARHDFVIKNCKAPVAACIDGLAVAIEPMDTDGDNIPDIEMACIFAEQFNASSVSLCGYPITFSFSADTTDVKMTVNCLNAGETLDIKLFVTDILGNQSCCFTTLVVQDNNDVDDCPEPEDCITLPDTTIIVDACDLDLGPRSMIEIDASVEVDEDCICDNYVVEFDDNFGNTDEGCFALIRDYRVIFFCSTPPDTFFFQQNVVLLNAEDPILTCPDDITVNANSTGTCETFVVVPLPDPGPCNSNVTFTNDSDFATSNDGAASGVYPVGTTTVTYTGSDECGNSATCTVDITVNDVNPPVCNVGDITVDLGADGTVTITGDLLDLGSTDVCDDMFTYEVTPNLFDCDDLGINNVTVIVTDASGNSATCAAGVFVDENLGPVCVAQDITVNLDANGNAVITASDIDNGSSDGCTDADVTLAIDQTTFNCDNITTTNEVQLTVTDSDGNTSTCTAIITVEDDIAPICNAQDITVSLNELGLAVITADQINNGSSDLCSTPTLAINQDTFRCENIGMNNIVTLIVTDASGNFSTCTASVTVEDDMLPMCIANDLTVNFDENGTAIIDPTDAYGGGRDECSDLTLEVTPAQFACNDVGDRTYTLTVTDANGNSSSCTGNVTIEDSNNPMLTCPADVTVSCDTDISNLDVFGEPTAFDECGIVQIQEDSTFNINTCNEGIIFRSFTVFDLAGNSTTCSQQITINGPQNPLTAADITFPADTLTINACTSLDPSMIPNGSPVVDESSVDCAMVTIDFMDTNLNPEAGGCPDTLRRDFTVVDSCQFDNMGAGVFTFSQIIIVNDQDAPVLTLPANMTINLPEGQCDTLLNLPTLVTDCDMNPTVANNSDFADDNDSADASGTYGVGTHVITVSATDFCGNTVTGMYTITINGVADGSYECVKIVRPITDNLNVVVDVNEAVNIVQPGCSSTNIIDASYSQADPNVDQMTFTCSTLGDIPVSIFFFENGVFIEACRILITISDPNGLCSQGGGNLASITGTVVDPNNDPMANVEVTLDGTGVNEVTNENGEYAFMDMPVGNSYQVKTTKDGDYLNGVSTLDLILIQRHILDAQKLDTPYKLIAADVNNTQSISASDIIELRKLILGVYDELPNNDSWRMIDASEQFADPSNPFMNSLPPSQVIYDLQGNQELDFMGIKIGDVDGSASANANSIDNRSTGDELALTVKKDDSAEGIVKYDFYSNNYANVGGFQFTMKLNNALDFVGVDYGVLKVSDSNIGLRYAEDGLITFSYHASSNESADQNAKLFTLVFQTESSEVGVPFTLNSDITTEEAYLDDKIGGVELRYDEESLNAAEVQLYQNQPNPWSESTSISFYVPSTMDVELKVVDVAGKLMKKVKAQYSQGLHTIQLSENEIPSSGILFYEIITEESRLMHKMLLLR